MNKAATFTQHVKKRVQGTEVLYADFLSQRGIYQKRHVVNELSAEPKRNVAFPLDCYKLVFGENWRMSEPARDDL